MRVLRQGIKGPDPDVIKWQYFLIGQEQLYKGEADGWFGPKTHRATKRFQSSAGLVSDGVVGPKTYGAAMARGFHTDAVKHPDTSKTSPHWPPKPRPSVNRKLTFAERERLLGHIEWVAAPTNGNPERIKITNDFISKHVVRITVPQMKRLAEMHPNGRWPRTGRVHVNKVLADPFLELFRAWDEAALLEGLLSYWGVGNPRLIRGSRSTLSNHAHFGAIDLNCYENAMGCTPALLGQKGCLREHAAVALELGWIWGGWFPRKDGMHEEPGSKLARRLGVTLDS